MSFNATIGGTTATSYVTVAEASTYFADRLNAAAWTAALSTGNEEKALIMATYRLERFEYIGVKVTETQSLKWPRDGVVDEEGEEVQTTEIPRGIQWATFELALFLLQNAGVAGASGFQGIRRLRHDKFEIEPITNSPTADLPESILDLLVPFLLPKGYLRRAG